MLIRVQKWMVDYWCGVVYADEGEVIKGADKKRARIAKAFLHSV